MSTRRLSIALLILGTTGTVVSDSANACCLTDWLFGRSRTPYAAGYAPYQAMYTPIGTPQILTTPVGGMPYSAGYSGTYAANYAPGYTALPLTPPGFTNGVFQAQRPAYFDNPSVYTGLPTVANAQAGYSVPITSNYRGGAPATSSGYFGAANSYPTSPYSAGMPINSSYAAPYAANAYSSNFQSAAAPGLPMTTVTPSGSPVTAIPTTQVAPLLRRKLNPVVAG